MPRSRYQMLYPNQSLIYASFSQLPAHPFR
jgi:hypothetical protein